MNPVVHLRHAEVFRDTAKAPQEARDAFETLSAAYRRVCPVFGNFTMAGKLADAPEQLDAIALAALKAAAAIRSAPR